MKKYIFHILVTFVWFNGLITAANILEREFDYIAIMILIGSIIMVLSQGALLVCQLQEELERI
jgi:hypothetical protein